MTLMGQAGSTTRTDPTTLIGQAGLITRVGPMTLTSPMTRSCQAGPTRRVRQIGPARRPRRVGLARLDDLDDEMFNNIFFMFKKKVHRRALTHRVFLWFCPLWASLMGGFIVLWVKACMDQGLTLWAGPN